MNGLRRDGSDVPVWRPMRPADLPAVVAVADVVHLDYPERPEVMAERLSLFPQGCLCAGLAGDGIVGYAIMHPGRIGRPPALDALLGSLPDHADCLYIHDVAILDVARSAGLGARLIDVAVELASQSALNALALTAVNGSVQYWERQGFSTLPPDETLAAKLRSYSADAAYMLRRL
jgi:GNAT superfamily N-acetyltransferase